MAIHYRTRGFVLKKENLREADQLFTVYTKDFGKLKILARAIRKIKSKLKGNFRSLCLSEIEFIQGKTYKTLTDALLIQNFSELKKDLKRLRILYKTSEVTDDLIGGQEPDKKIWQLLLDVLEKLDNLQFTISDLRLIYYYWLWNLLSILGYRPELYNCSLCQKKLEPEKLYFSPKEGGVICDNCSKKIKTQFSSIDPDTIKILRLILGEDWATLGKLKIEKANLKKLEALSRNFLSFVLSQTK